MRGLLSMGLVLAVAGCAQLGIGPKTDAPASMPAPGRIAPAPKPTANSAAAFDTTTAAQRAEAAQKPATGEAKLGVTIASLGDPTDPGFWMRTGLVSVESKGRIENPKTGKSAKVTLIPTGKPAGAGSEVSLPALRLLEVPLTELPELTVYRL
ncbi:D-galactarate dehydratase [uncultured Thioclava sp.]|mgnify:CR=1 FL=1|uniref:D-galactarate dehydratase n=1 Tax=Thioclava arctica TaxID=3238301 RepID=A0ABV3TLW5_9RHOB|nr:D-galactarate dehydratase [uncultured Thioclava sp.]